VSAAAIETQYEAAAPLLRLSRRSGSFNQSQSNGCIAGASGGDFAIRPKSSRGTEVLAGWDHWFMDDLRGGRQNRCVFDVKREPGISVVAPHPRFPWWLGGRIAKSQGARFMARHRFSSV
jgi:hypothetical protein